MEKVALIVSIVSAILSVFAIIVAVPAARWSQYQKKQANAGIHFSLSVFCNEDSDELYANFLLINFSSQPCSVLRVDITCGGYTQCVFIKELLEHCIQKELLMQPKGVLNINSVKLNFTKAEYENEVNRIDPYRVLLANIYTNQKTEPFAIDLRIGPDDSGA